MARETSPFVVGDYWLDQRRGRASQVWQIAFYDEDTRSISYRSTRCVDVEEAKKVILAFVEKQRSKAPSEDDSQVKVVPQLIHYWDEHGSKTIGEDSIASILRGFIGFLMQDEATIACSFTDLKPAVWRRYVAWCREPHDYSIVWKGKRFIHESEGLSDASIKKGIRIITAALNHAVNEERALVAPKVPKTITEKLKTAGRDRVLSMKELGAMIGYARSDKPLLNYILLILGTGVRPEAALKMVPKDQFKPDYGLIDLHPIGAPFTKKRNPIVPCIPPLAAMLDGCEGYWVAEEDGTQIDSLKRRWRTMRDVLKFGDDVIAKAIRHTVATELEWRGADETQIERLLGHTPENRTSSIYRHYNPNKMASVRDTLVEIWNDAMAAADKWCERYVVGKGPKGKLVLVERKNLPFDPDPTRRPTVTESMSPQQSEEAKQRRREQINAARKARKARLQEESKKKAA